MTTPDYSPYAQQYARSRPTYPDELFAYLVSLVQKHDRAWDCATGNGQAAIALAKRFQQVIATDISAEQIRHGFPHPRIEYRVAPSEESGLDDASIDLVTVASAVHWFDLDRFFAEVRRVVRPGGVLAVWSYHIGHVDPPFDQVFLRFYQDVLSPYFAPGAKLVDERYETLALPGEALDGKRFHVRADWTYEQMLAFIESWSATQKYLEEKGENPARLIGDELKSVWGPPEKIHAIRWPLFLRISRVEAG